MISRTSYDKVLNALSARVTPLNSHETKELMPRTTQMSSSGQTKLVLAGAHSKLASSLSNAAGSLHRPLSGQKAGLQRQQPAAEQLPQEQNIRAQQRELDLEQQQKEQEGFMQRYQYRQAQRESSPAELPVKEPAAFKPQEFVSPLPESELVKPLGLSPLAQSPFLGRPTSEPASVAQLQSQERNMSEAELERELLRPEQVSSGEEGMRQESAQGVTV